MNGEITYFKNYILVTSCKNEENNLPYLIDSIASQTITPILWVVIDDGSTDNTSQIISKSSEKYDWIQYIKGDSNKRDLGLHLSTVLNEGFKHAVSYCNENDCVYNYLGNVDGDLTFEKTFFENLMNEFEKNLQLGVASGGTNHIIGDQIRHAKVSVNEPSGGHMLIRKECFEEIGGFPISYAADSVIKAKARLRGWLTRRFEENIATEIRDVGSAEGYWRGYHHRGAASYYLNLNPIHVLVRVIKFTFTKPYYGGIAYLLSYIDCVLSIDEQIADKEVRQYFWNKWKEHLQFMSFW